MRTFIVSIAGVIGFATSISSQGASTLYGVSSGSGTDNLYTIDKNGGTATLMGSLGKVGPYSPNVNSLAYDTSRNMMFGFESVANQLVTIDLTTGDATSIGPVGFDTVHGMAYDSSRDALFGFNAGTDQLLTIDPNSGVATVIGPANFNDHRVINNLAYYPDTDTLIARDSTLTSSPFVTIDPDTGAGSVTVISSEEFIDHHRALTYDPSRDTMFGSTLSEDPNDPRDELTTMNPLTGYTEIVGSTGVTALTGMSAVPQPVPVPATLPLLLAGAGGLAWVARRRS